MNLVQLPNDALIGEVERIIKMGREVIIRTKGNSMLPYIRGDRDSVLLKSPATLEVGDIVLVRLHGRFVMHRIIEKSGDSFVMMGDGNVRGTESFLQQDVIAVVVEIIKPDGSSVKPGKASI